MKTRWVLLLAPLLLGVAARADPVAVPHVLPLSGTGGYGLGTTRVIDFDFGYGFTSVDHASIDWAGSVAPGTCYSTTIGYFSCTTNFVAYLESPGPGTWWGTSSGATFDTERRLGPPQSNPSTLFLEGGTGTIQLYLDQIVIIDGNVVQPPFGQLTDVNLVIVGVAESPTCGDGAIDPLEYCDDANLDPGDGCDDRCVEEPFYACSGEPSVCVPSAIGISLVLDRDGLGGGALFDGPTDLAIGPDGALYAAANASNNVVRITPDGVATELMNYNSPGPLGTLSGPSYVEFDTNGNLYVAESSGSFDQIFKRTPSGTLSVPIDETGDGGAYPLGTTPGPLAADALGNAYVSGGTVVFRIAPDESLSILIEGSGDGAHGLLRPSAPAFDAAGSAYVAGRYSKNVFRIDPDGTITQILDETSNGSGFPLVSPRAVRVGGDGTVYVLDQSQVLALSPGGTVSQLLGPDGDGMGNVFSLGSSMTLSPAGKLYVTAVGSDNAFEIDLAAGGAVREIIDITGDGIGNYCDYPSDIGVASDGAVYVTGSNSDNIFKIVLEEPARAVPATSRGALVAIALALLLVGSAIAGAGRTLTRNE